MSEFTSKMLREVRKSSNLSQDEVAKRLRISKRKLQSIETNEHSVSVEDIVEFAKLYKVDVRELILESYIESGEEQILCNRYASFLKLFDQLSDKDKEDIVWVVRQRVNRKI